MSGRARRRDPSSLRLLAGLAGLALLAAHGCAASSSSGGTGGETGGSSGSGSGGISGSGGSSSGSGGSGGPGGAQGSGGHPGAGSGGSTGSGGAVAGTGGAPAVACNLDIELVNPASLDDVEAGPGVTVTVRGVATEYPTMPLTWTWQITQDDGTSVRATAIDGTNTTVQFPVKTPAKYQVMAQVSGDQNCHPKTLIVTATASQGPAFTFRMTAPGFPIQQTRVKLSDGPSGNFQLDQGQPFTIKPVNPTDGTLRGTYVRITSSDSSFDIEGDTTHSPMTATLLQNQTYALLIVPADPADPAAAFAPRSKISLPGDWNAQVLAIDQGTQVSGRALAADGTPLQNARMQLRQGTVPSTIGFSDTAGAIGLWTRDGTMSAIIVPSDGSGLPVATTADASITSANGAPLSLTMRWAAMAQGTLTVQVRGPDGTSPVANAQVRLSSSGTPYVAGTLTIQSPNTKDVTLMPAASVTDNLPTGSDGSVTFPPFPAGSYTVTVIPAAGSAPAATTTTTLTLTGGTSRQTITLARKATLTGKVLPLAGAPGALVTAIDVGDLCTGTSACASGAPTTGGSAATGAVVSGQADDQGTFSLAVDPDRTYQLVIQPSVGDATPPGRAVLPPFRVCSTATGPCKTTNNGNIGTITLPSGTAYQGALSGNHPVGAGALIQVFCVSSSPTCVDPTVSLAEATSLGDGTFSLILPSTAVQITPPVSN